MVRLSVVLLVLMLSGCAGVHGGYRFDTWDRINQEASQQPRAKWFADHDAMRHMQCFPARCQHY